MDPRIETKARYNVYYLISLTQLFTKTTREKIARTKLCKVNKHFQRKDFPSTFKDLQIFGAMCFSAMMYPMMRRMGVKGFIKKATTGESDERRSYGNVPPMPYKSDEETVNGSPSMERRMFGLRIAMMK